MKRVISVLVLTSIFINLSLFGLPRIKGMNLMGPKVAYADEQEIPESTRWVVFGLLLLYLLYKNISTEVPVSPFARPSIAPLKMGKRIAVNKAYQLDNAWKITLNSYQLFEGGAIEFNFLVENLQNKVASCELKTSTYLMDRRGNKYHKVHISKPGRREYIPNVPVEIKVSFFDLKEGMEAFILYLNFEGNILLENRWEGRELFFGPIK